ncbi:hypothetical protein TrLO_g9638 [Triparma laevis f. longispina]|uniref:Uncharacterized protein n=1 Tax=Triparma laevis f. longispina TaxID=1714387 RepID=A0A9W7FS99_9STRA|nr:hypothetical protein TrLO_g9638 [Triparma laevis f. longispina]
MTLQLFASLAFIAASLWYSEYASALESPTASRSAQNRLTKLGFASTRPSSNFLPVTSSLERRCLTKQNKCRAISTTSLGNNRNSFKSSTSLSAFGGGPGLPPSGGPPNGNNQQLVSSLVSLSLFALLFFSPIGQIFFSITNGLFILAFSIPLLAFAGFSIYRTFFIVEAPCPNCGAAAAAPRYNDGQPQQTSVCLTCQSFLRATRDNKGLEICNQSPDFQNVNEASNPFADIFGTERAAQATKGKTNQNDVKRSNTVIDVDVEIKDDE